MSSVGILTLGCKVNTYESLFIENLLKKAGYEIKDFKEKCDIYIINTCTVTNTSDIKSKKMIRNAIHRNQDACIIAMGCFIEANKQYYEDGVDILIGNKDKSKIVEFIQEYEKKKETIKNLYENNQTIFENMEIDSFPGRTRAFVKIQDGCENFCSYCIIPYVRGKCRSKKKETIIEEVKKLVENGYYEIVLTGIHTGSYGIDLDISFADLLKELVKIKGLKRLRISSIETTELNDEVLKIIKESKIIVDHFHIPIQSGSDEILKAMNRKYDLNFYKKKIAEIRKIRPNCSITTDIIVGFPGETEELFQKSMKTCEEIGFAKLHVFPYSERKNTKAMELPNHIEVNKKKEYARRMLELSKTLEIKEMKKNLGQKVEVLIEEKKEKESIGHTGNYLHVKIRKEIPTNTFIEVTLKEIEYPYMIGE